MGDTGTVVPMRMVEKHNLDLDTWDKDAITLHDAQDKEMAVQGTARLFVIPPGCRVLRMVTGVVSTSLVGEVLLGWTAMQDWGLIGEDFPAVKDPVNPDT